MNSSICFFNFTVTPWVHTAFALKANHEIPCQPLLPPFCNDTGEMYWVWQLNRSLVIGSKPCNLKVQIEIFIIGGLSFWYGNFPNLNLLLVCFFRLYDMGLDISKLSSTTHNVHIPTSQAVASPDPTRLFPSLGIPQSI